MVRILVSACLLGACCRYDGRSNENTAVLSLLERPDVQLVPVCPEQLGGLPTPRVPSECLGEGVVSQTGTDVTAQFSKGAQEALGMAQRFGCKMAVLKERSPSCGHGLIYDGSFSHTRIPGSGMTARLLEAENLPIYGESQIRALLDALDQQKES